MSITLKVREIIAAQALVTLDDVGVETGLADLGLDSVALVEIIFAVEEAFDITVPLNATAQTHTFTYDSVAAIVAGVEHLLNEQAK